ncbi:MULTISPECIES: ABC transporter permease subunit [unclassified Sinorhizobium]|uniref:amino acid ABC transporter permease n=1 Tax=unclassified Sinorhizobium TaxID=2613772 RepID=UPI0024C21DD8|nr:MULTISPECIES: ABC transporter permease subunit [unclassified Sinorhizobium]MDK1376786.1 ABC transporter permease subunit [Sinorhizobium sp. 6-70]MDK1479557.1 ABC transporter permease subunit [Sinorhizobium sp. 6-117]
MLSTLLDNRHVRSVALQVLLLVGFASLLYWLWSNTAENLTARGIHVGFEYLHRQANFPISESVLPYDPSDTFGWAYLVGLTNTAAISLLAIVASTIFGLFIALIRLARNPLASGMAASFVGGVRNMPLIVQLLFWYALATTLLPAPKQAFNPFPGIYLSLRGLYVPSVSLGPYGFAFLVASAALAMTFWRFRQSLPWILRGVSAAGTTLGMFILGTIALEPSVNLPELKGFNFAGGMRLSPEFAALMLGLIIYTSVFISEVVRGGIEAVSRGQSEAGRALGLSERQTMFRIIVPQALRVIIPPMTSQYLSTVKNTTLALAVGYPELGLVVGTVINQTGQAIESIAILLSVFLTISIAVSFFMNWYNARVALVTR